MTAAEVTAVVPTRNRRDLLARTLGAVLAQGIPVRVVVVDEASTDGTREWLASLRDDRVEVVRNERPHGSAGARNVGLERVTTEIVAFCDDDDLWAPDKLAAQVEAMRGADAGWCTVGSVLFEGGDRVVGHQRPPAPDGLLPQLLRANVVPGGGSGVAARTDLVRDAGGFRPEQDHAEDWDLWIRLAERSSAAAVDRPCVAYRIWASSSSDVPGMREAFDEIAGRYRHLASRLGSLPDRMAHERWLAKQHLRSGARVAAARAYAGLASDGDRSLYLRAAASFVAPRATERIGTWRAARGVPSWWADEAAGWMAGVRPVGAESGARA